MIYVDKYKNIIYNITEKIYTYNKDVNMKKKNIIEFQDSTEMAIFYIEVYIFSYERYYWCQSIISSRGIKINILFINKIKDQQGYL